MNQKGPLEDYPTSKPFPEYNRPQHGTIEAYIIRFEEYQSRLGRPDHIRREEFIYKTRQESSGHHCLWERKTWSEIKQTLTPFLIPSQIQEYYGTLDQAPMSASEYFSSCKFTEALRSGARNIFLFTNTLSADTAFRDLLGYFPHIYHRISKIINNYCPEVNEALKQSKIALNRYIDKPPQFFQNLYLQVLKDAEDSVFFTRYDSKLLKFIPSGVPDYILNYDRSTGSTSNPDTNSKVIEPIKNDSGKPSSPVGDLLHKRLVGFDYCASKTFPEYGLLKHGALFHYLISFEECQAKLGSSDIQRRKEFLLKTHDSPHYAWKQMTWSEIKKSVCPYTTPKSYQEYRGLLSKPPMEARFSFNEVYIKALETGARDLFLSNSLSADTAFRDLLVHFPHLYFDIVKMIQKYSPKVAKTLKHPTTPLSNNLQEKPQFFQNLFLQVLEDALHSVTFSCLDDKLAKALPAEIPDYIRNPPKPEKASKPETATSSSIVEYYVNAGILTWQSNKLADSRGVLFTPIKEGILQSKQFADAVCQISP